MYTILGVQHRSGNRKSDGQPYDFFQVHYCYDSLDPNEGQLVATCSATPQQMSYANSIGVRVGGNFVPVLDRSGRLMQFIPCLE